MFSKEEIDVMYSQALLCHTIADSNISDVGKYAKKYGYPTVIEVDKYDQKAYVLINSQDVLIAFQGTNSFFDIILDFSVYHTPIESGKVHKGFYTAWNLIKRDLINVIKPHKNKNIRITGHSLGSAIATHCAVDLAYDGYKIQTSYIFATPKTGNKKWVSYIEDAQINLIRIVNTQDIVSRVPWWVGYAHTSNVAYLNKNGKFSNKPSLYLVFWFNFIVASLLMCFKDHRIVEYITRLELSKKLTQ